MEKWKLLLEEKVALAANKCARNWAIRAWRMCWQAKSAAIWRAVIRLPAPEFASGRQLLLYTPTVKEVTTHGLIRQLPAMSRELLAPFSKRRHNDTLLPALQDFDADLAIGKFGILEPDPRGQCDRATSRRNRCCAGARVGVRRNGGIVWAAWIVGLLLRPLAGSKTSGVKIALAFDFQRH